MKKITFKLIVAPVLAFALFSFNLPEDWIKAGSHPSSYDMGIDKGSGPEGKNAATIKSIDKKINGFGTLMQMCLADKYAGKRVRMSALVKSKDVEEWAGLWFRVDQANSSDPLSFDNMQDRAIKGTTDWKKYEIVLDVPQRASKLAYGALISGTGQIWFTNIKFEIVDSSVPTTGMGKSEKSLQEPTNLNFDK
jgi:hypothetical protein